MVSIVMLYYNIILWDHSRTCGPSLNERRYAARDCTRDGMSSTEESRKANGLCPTETLRAGSAQQWRVVRQTERELGYGPDCSKLKESFAYLRAFCDDSDNGILIIVFIKLF